MKLEIRQADGTWLDLGTVSDMAWMRVPPETGQPGQARVTPDLPVYKTITLGIAHTVRDVRQKPPFWAKKWKGPKS